MMMMMMMMMIIIIIIIIIGIVAYNSPWVMDVRMLISELFCAPRIHTVAEVSFEWEKTRISEEMSSKIFLGGNAFGLNSEGV
jgi:hypothetical protein